MKIFTHTTGSARSRRWTWLERTRQTASRASSSWRWRRRRTLPLLERGDASPIDYHKFDVVVDIILVSFTVVWKASFTNRCLAFRAK